MSGAYWETFLGRGIEFRHFFKLSFFPAELILKNLSNKNDSRGPGAYSLRKVLKICITVMVILVLFEQFSGKFCV